MIVTLIRYKSYQTFYEFQKKMTRVVDKVWSVWIRKQDMLLKKVSSTCKVNNKILSFVSKKCWTFMGPEMDWSWKGKESLKKVPHCRSITYVHRTKEQMQIMPSRKFLVKHFSLRHFLHLSFHQLKTYQTFSLIDVTNHFASRKHLTRELTTVIQLIQLSLTSKTGKYNIPDKASPIKSGSMMQLITFSYHQKPEVKKVEGNFRVI